VSFASTSKSSSLISISVAAGDRAKIESKLKYANLGLVEVRTIDGKLVADQELDERR
jgi:hypothetical protein